ncbi:MAG: copper-translocating P-type ATPase [Deltaproteobacteria bacterium]|nr:copper-translocating P-type ATPase [Deltaproteobacteria bacterium]
MHCASCSSRIEKVVGAMAGVTRVAVNLATEKIDLSWDSNRVDLPGIAERIAGLGFELVTPGAEARISLGVSGMHCASCSSRIEKVVGGLPGVKSCEVNLATGLARVTLDPDLISQRQVRETIDGLGFKAEPLTSSTDFLSGQQQDLHARLLVLRQRLIPLFILAMLVMVVSMGHMAGLSLPDLINPVTEPLHFALLQFVLVLPVLWFGRGFYIIGFPSLLRGAPNMDSLIAVGTGAAFVYSTWNLVEIGLGFEAAARAHDLYFESAAMLIALVSLGKYLEARSKARTSDAIRQLMQLAPDRATLIKGDSQEEILVDEIEVGDLLFIRPGERLPIDGVIEQGASSVDESMLTGESLAVQKGQGDEVVSGTLNKNGILHVRAAKVGKDTMLNRIISMVQDAQGSKAPIANLADRISLYFVPAVMVIATLAGLSWYFIGQAEFTFALRIFIAVMVIACPCAMGLATPTSIMVGTGRGAQLGVLVKNGEALEMAQKVETIVFDKTGTLTHGKPGLTDLGNYSSFSDDELLLLMACAETGSEHPLAEAIVQAARNRNMQPVAPADFTALPGRGISAAVHDPRNSRQPLLQVLIGNFELMQEKNIGVAGEIYRGADELADAGKTPLFAAIDGGFAALVAIADKIKDEAPATVSKLREMGIEVVMLTGDHEKTARAIAGQAGITEVIARVLPDHKAEEIERIKKRGRVVAMVGDGINDAPALATADLGIAMGTGIDVAIESGDIVLMQGNLAQVLTALKLSRATMRNIKQNLFWAFAYNVIGIPVAAGLLFIFGGPTLNPMIAGAAMALSSVSVVSNALRLRFFTP